MIVEARAANCFSSDYLLTSDGHAIGKLEGRWFGEGLDIALLSRRQLRLEKESWLGSHFALKDGADETLVEADRSGFFSSGWDLSLTIGPAELVRAGWFDSGFLVKQNGRALARVDRLGFCERGWSVEGDPALHEIDLLFVGLVYHIIQKRRSRQHAAGGHAAGS